jgi:hypothetical protein
MPYFRRTGPTTWTPTEHVGGAWTLDEQHVAPSFGLLTHLVEADHAARRPDDRLAVSRLSFDILGVLPMEEVDVEVHLLRPGRTIELVEAVLSHAGRPAVLLRAWLTQARDTAAVAGSDLSHLPPPGDLAPWDPTEVWPGGFIASVEVRRRQAAPGRAAYWVRTDVPLLDEPTGPLATLAGLLDIANGMTVREDPARVAFPNLDLTAHLVRDPRPGPQGWLGFDTTVTFGPDGRGLTSSVVHDEDGPFGTVAQTLTVRPAVD